MDEIRNGQLWSIYIQECWTVTKSFWIVNQTVKCDYLITATCLKHFNNICGKASMKISSLIYLFRSSRCSSWIRKKRNNGGNFLSTRFFHTRNCQNKFHNSIINILILERLNNIDIMTSNQIQYLYWYLSIIKSSSYMTTQSSIQICGNLFPQYLRIKSKYFQIRKLTYFWC